jgi:site-specific DNA recombinase
MDRADRADNGGGAIAVYMRVSTEEQKQQGTIETQRAVLERYLAVQGEAAAFYEDEAVSGTIAFANRPAGRRLMDDVHAGRVRTIVVRKLDRLGRNAREILIATHAIEQAGARLVSLKESVDTSTSAGRFFLTVLAGIAELERDTILERAEEGMARRLTDGGWMGGWAPYGYRVEGKKRDARLVIDDTLDEGSSYSEPDAFRLMWHLLVEQDWTMDDIAERLIELDIPTRKGGRWLATTVYRLLIDPTYCGEHVYRAKDGTEHVQAVPAIITREQHERALATLADHRRTARMRSGGPRTYLLARMVRCNECGSMYTSNWSGMNSGKGLQRRYYFCSTHHFRSMAAVRMRAKYDGAMADCIGRSIHADALEAQIWGQIVT